MTVAGLLAVLVSPCIGLYKVQVPSGRQLPMLTVKLGGATLLPLRPHRDSGGLIIRSNARVDMKYIRGKENLRRQREGLGYAVQEQDLNSRLWNVSIQPEGEPSGLLLINRDSLEARVRIKRYSHGDPRLPVVLLAGGIVLMIFGFAVLVVRQGRPLILG